MTITTKKAVTAKKPVVKKTTTKKKVVSKKTVTKKPLTGKALIFADEAHSFWVCDGQILNSLKALQNAFSTMDKKVYAYHVTKSRHDFAQWVRVVLCDKVCAEELQKAKTPVSAKVVVTRHLKQYLT